MIDGYDVLPFIPAVPLSQSPPVQDYLSALITQQRTEPLQRPRRSSGLSEYGQRMLAAGTEHLFAPVNWLWKLIGIPGYSTQMAIRRELIHHLLGAFVDPRIGRANVALMRMLDKGWQRVGKTPPPRRGNQGIAHEHAANWIRECLKKQGHEAFCEYPVPETSTHYADTAGIVDGKLHVWEVVYECHANLVSHLTECFLVSNSVATATVVAFTKTHLKSLRTLVHKAQSLSPYADRIKFETIEPIMRRLFT